MVDAVSFMIWLAVAVSIGFACGYACKASLDAVVFKTIDDIRTGRDSALDLLAIERKNLREIEARSIQLVGDKTIRLPTGYKTG